MDPLRDDGLLYEKLLRHNGVKTIIDVYSGVPHGVTVPYPHLAASRKYQVDVIARIGELLGKHVERDLIEQTFPWPRR
jgi:acetyl esterase/lipase